MMIACEIKDNTITIHNVCYILVAGVKKTLEYDGALIVLAASNAQRNDWDAAPPERYRNVYAFNPDGSMKWRIPLNAPLESIQHKDAYSNIWISETGKLMAYCSVGYTYEVNPDNGDLTLIPGRPW